MLYGIQNSEMQKKFFVTSSLQYSIDVLKCTIHKLYQVSHTYATGAEALEGYSPEKGLRV